jgi:hypothetical protein
MRSRSAQDDKTRMTNEAGTATIDQLIISTLYAEPVEHWKYHRETRRVSHEPRGVQQAGAHGGEAKSYFTGRGQNHHRQAALRGLRGRI